MDPVVVTNTSRYQWDYPVSVQIEQWQWLQQDLKAADRNRSSAPWIFVFAHFPLYCSGGGDCLRQASYMRNGIPNYTEYAWEKVLQDYKVDMYISGHMHNYERTLPVYNGTSHKKWLANPNVIRGADAPIYIVTGAPGNVEGQTAFKSALPFSAARSQNYGYNHMVIHNDTHLEWTFIVACDANLTASQCNHSSDVGTVADTMLLVK
jgi:hypothetical protein